MPTPTITIRKEQPPDAAGIYRVHAAAFPSPAEARLVNLLRDGGKLDISLVAVQTEAPGHNEVVGHVALSPVTIAGRVVGLGLAPVAVLPRVQRGGIGGKLIEAGLHACRVAGIGLVVVLGDPNYYGRFGFLAARTWGLRDEYQGGDAFQAIELMPGAAPPGGGLVQYAPQFASLG